MEKHYKVLATKYRPDNFDNLIGQDVLVRTLTNAINTNRIANAFLLTGIRGVGKTTTARIIARVLNCIGEDGQGQPTVDPCGKCSNCISIKEDRHPDILEMDAASRTGVNDIREIIDSTQYLPTSARYKIYIIDEVHMLSKSAFNALLKTLEEPPAHVKFIFATTEINKIPITILSRCQRFDLRRINKETLLPHLAKIAKAESAEIDEDALAIIADASEGSVRDSLSLLDQAIAHSDGGVTAQMARDMLGLADNSRIIDLFEAATKGDCAECLAIFKDLYDNGADAILICQDLLEFVYLATKIKIMPKNDFALTMSEVEYDRASAMAQSFGMAYLTRCWQLLLKGLGEVKTAPNGFMAAEMILVRLAYMSDLPSPEKIIQGLKSGGVEASSVSMARSAPSYNGGGAKAALAPKQEPVVVTEEISSFEKMVETFKKNREILLHSWLESDVRVVKFESGKVEINPTDNVPADFPSRISTKLKEWTGQNWMVIISRDKASKTIHEQKQIEADALREKLSHHANVRKVLEMFPGSKISDVE